MASLGALWRASSENLQGPWGLASCDASRASCVCHDQKLSSWRKVWPRCASTSCCSLDSVQHRRG